MRQFANSATVNAATSRGAGKRRRVAALRKLHCKTRASKPALPRQPEIDPGLCAQSGMAIRPHYKRLAGRVNRQSAQVARFDQVLHRACRHAPLFACTGRVNRRDFLKRQARQGPRDEFPRYAAWNRSQPQRQSPPKGSANSESHRLAPPPRPPARASIASARAARFRSEMPWPRAR